MADVERSLCELLDKIAKEQQYDNYKIKLESVSTGGVTCISKLFRATISAADKEDINLFIKFASMGEKIRKTVPINRLYNTERLVYKDLIAIFKRIEEKHNVPEEHRLIIPKFYGYIDKYLEESIVIEDLAVKGFTTHDRMKSIDWEYASKSVNQVAKLHALSIAYGEENPEEFEKVLEDVKFQNMYGDAVETKESWDRIFETAIGATKEENREKLKKFIENTKSEIFMKYVKPFRRPVLVHGDFKSNNLMHKVNEDGSVQIVIVDYQTLQSGSPLLDLFYFIFSGTDAEFRAKYFDRIVEYYYIQLCESLRRLHLDPEKLYSREDFEYELQKILPYGLTIAVFTLQLVTVDENDAPNLDNDVELSDFVVKPSDVYVERVNGIVDDYVRWGILKCLSCMPCTITTQIHCYMWSSNF